MSEKGFRVEIPVSFKRRPSKPAQQATPDTESDAVPRIASLLALAHKWEGMVRRGTVDSYSQLARLTGLTKARVAQICDLVLISPRLHQALLLGRLPSSSHEIRHVLRQALWRAQEYAASHPLSKHASENRSFNSPSGHHRP